MFSVHDLRSPTPQTHRAPRVGILFAAFPFSKALKCLVCFHLILCTSVSGQTSTRFGFSGVCSWHGFRRALSVFRRFSSTVARGSAEARLIFFSAHLFPHACLCFKLWCSQAIRPCFLFSCMAICLVIYCLLRNHFFFFRRKGKKGKER